jgi:SecDF, P1 head subdomain/Protein translocase subunit SecDF, P1 domain, N-terminal
MTGPMSDEGFERDLRDVLAGLAPDGAPAHVHAAVARVPREVAVGRWGGVTALLRTHSGFAGLAATATTLAVIVGLAVVVGHPFGLGRFDGGTGPGGGPTPTTSPSVTPSPTPALGPAMRDEYQVLAANGVQPTSADLDVERSIIVHRLESLGLVAPDVSVAPPDRIVVTLPGVGSDALDEMRALIGTTGRVDFVPLGQTPVEQDQQLPQTTLDQPCDADHIVDCILFSGDQIAAASIGNDRAGLRTVDFVLKDTGKNLFANYTADHVGDYFAIVLDGKVISAPTINEAIPGGQVQISQSGIGGYPLADAQNLVTILQFGQLPFPLQEVTFGP